MDKWIIRYDAVIEDETLDHSIEESGLLIAASLSEATAQMEEYYGPTLLKITNLHYVLEGNIIFGSAEAIDTIEEGL